MRGTWQTTETGGRGGLVLAVVVVALAVGSGAASAAVSALVTIAIIVASVLGLAAVGGLAWLAYRACQGSAGRPVAAPAVYQLPPAAPQRLEASQPLAIEPPREYHLHIHGVSADELAAIIRNNRTEGE